MDARIYDQKQTELKLSEMIQKQNHSIQSLLNDYLPMQTKYTYNTKLLYVTGLIQFFESLKANGFNTDDIISTLIILKPSDIAKYLQQFAYKPDGRATSESYRASKLYPLRSLYKYLIKNNITEFNPAMNVEAPETKNIVEPVALNVKEINKVKENIQKGVGGLIAVGRQRDWQNRDLALIQLGLVTGLRVTAIRQIDISDIDFDAVPVSIKVVEKGNIKKEVYVDTNTVRIIKDWLVDRTELIAKNQLEENAKNALFISKKRQRISCKAIERIVEKYSYNINKHITPHKLRSTFAVNLYDLTGDIYAVADALGHKSTETTKRYAGVSKEKKTQNARLIGELFK